MRTKVQWNSVAGVRTVRGGIGFWLTAVAVAGFLACVVILTPAAAQAPAPSSFYESFSSNMPNELEQSPSCNFGLVAFNGINVTFPYAGGRDYLRTLANYNNTNFVADVTVTIQDGFGGYGIAFFGLGAGDGNPDFFCEPDVAPAAYVRIFPGDFDIATDDVAAVGFTTDFDPSAGPDEHQQETPGAGGAGRHRARLTWNHDVKTLTFAIDQNYTGGTFAPDTTIGITVNDSPTSFGDTSTRIYIGGNGNQTFDDLRVVALAGTAGAIDCHRQSVALLVKQFGNMDRAASVLGFAKVKDLESLIYGFCGN